MKNLSALIVMAFVACPGFAQNLVINPGFEQHSAAMSLSWLTGADMFRCFNVTGWTQPTNGSSDFFFRSTTSPAMNIKPYAGEHEAASGNAFAGFINWVPGREYREYITGELSQPLEKGKKYAFRMKVCTGNFNPYFVNELGAYFSEDRLEDRSTQVTLKQQPQVWLDVSPMKDSPETWIEVSNVFIAQGGEKYFTFGNFINDSLVKVSTLNNRTDGFCAYAYYYADDIVVEPTDEAPASRIPKTALSDQIGSGKTFIARGINFDLDKSTLRPESYLQLHEIAAELKRQPELKVDIRGYTDSSGSEPHNIQLSRSRAKAVADYLVETGIDRSRITYGGYGSADPVSSYDPALNRRVEFVFR